MADENKPKGRVVTGRVISNKCDQTITVLIERREPHPVYGKYIRRSTKVHAHDEKNECNEGDLVTVRESRPYSKTKTWVLVSIDERAPAPDAAHA
ncbi:MAG TPA: 30S ribosomal protein S17 [Pseudomonadales bacterium]|nr:30S ribosomal protein S17 [Pseudomonadales bacterium]